MCHDVRCGCDLGGVINHFKAFMLHLLKDQRNLLAEDPLNVLKVYWGEHTMYTESGYKLMLAQSVCARPFVGPGDKASFNINYIHVPFVRN